MPSFPDRSTGQETKSTTFGRKKPNRKYDINKPTLIHVGNHLIDPSDVSSISKIRDRDLYIIRQRSNPNPDYPLWSTHAEILILMEHFNIITGD